MHKQTTTVFTYVVIDEFGKRRPEAGSYIGRKPASVRTLRAFVNRAIHQYIPASRLDTLIVCGRMPTLPAGLAQIGIK